MELVIRHGWRFVFFVLIQVLVFRQIEPGLGIHIMVYPVFIVLLPFEISVVFSMFLAFAMGISIDAMSDTYGLHTSSLVLFAYLRPLFLKIFSPRDGYDNLREPNIHEMGYRWFLLTTGSLLAIHHFWFFLIEAFKWNELGYILMKTILSLPISFIFIILIQFLIIKRRQQE